MEQLLLMFTKFLIYTDKHYRQIYWYIFLLSLVFRFAFLLFGAEVFFGKEHFYVVGDEMVGDTYHWLTFVKNFFEYGIYTDELGSNTGYFSRPPGYAVFIGLVYLICGQQTERAFQVMVFIQVFMDAACVYLIYHIISKSFTQVAAHRTALFACFLYAIYPFAIVQSVLLIAESLSIFFLFLSLYFFTRKSTNASYLLSGIFIAFAVLLRLQLLLLVPLLILSIIYVYSQQREILIRYTLVFSLAFTAIYIAWPLRNFLISKKLIFTQKLNEHGIYAPDYMFFVDYIFGMQTNSEPLFSQIILNKAVDIPTAVMVHPEDSLQFIQLVVLLRKCGEGFSYRRFQQGMVDKPLYENQSCNDEIVDIINQLIEHQQQYNALNYYLGVPLSNFSKALFKNRLTAEHQNALLNIAVYVLFSYRTLTIILGLAALLFLLKKTGIIEPPIHIVALAYTLLWYGVNSFYVRNMEMRYLLQADVLLLIFCPFFFFYISSFNLKGDFFRNKLRNRVRTF